MRKAALHYGKLFAQGAAILFAAFVALTGMVALCTLLYLFWRDVVFGGFL